MQRWYISRSLHPANESERAAYKAPPKPNHDRMIRRGYNTDPGKHNQGGGPS